MSDTEFTTSSMQANVAKAFAPVVDAVKSMGAKMEVPQAARDFVTRSAETAKDRAADMHASAVKATDTFEAAASQSVSRVAKFSRDVQAAAYDDAAALFASVTRLAGAKSLEEAMQVQVDYMRERAEVSIARAKSMFDTVSGSITEGAKKAGEKISADIQSFSKAA